MNIHDFIEEFRSVIVASVGRDANPLYHPGTDRKVISKLIKELPRRPIASQIDAIGGIVRALQSRDSAILVGEMGLGKTYISIAAAAALGGGAPGLRHHSRGAGVADAARPAAAGRAAADPVRPHRRGGQPQPRVVAGQVALQLLGQAHPVEQEVHDRQAAQPPADQLERLR